jgi:hypothetical protein
MTVFFAIVSRKPGMRYAILAMAFSVAMPGCRSKDDENGW